VCQLEYRTEVNKLTVTGITSVTAKIDKLLDLNGKKWFDTSEPAAPTKTDAGIDWSDAFSVYVVIVEAYANGLTKLYTLTRVVDPCTYSTIEAPPSPDVLTTKTENP
jgi:hypothetical protein